MKKTTYLLGLLLCLSVQLLQARREAEFKHVLREYTLQEDGTVQMHCRKELTLYTHTAMNGTYGETFIAYNPRYQKLHINESFTRQTDGTLVKTPSNAFVDVLPSAAADAPDFNHLRERVVVHTGLELGATIVLDYTLTTFPGFGPFLLDERLQETSPVKKMEIKISVPDADKYRIELYGLPFQKLERQGTGYTATLYDIPALSRERLLPGGGRCEARLLAAPATGYDPAAAFKAALPQDTSLKTLADSLLQTTNTSAENKMLALASYTARRLARTPLSFKDTGERLRSPLQVIKGGYATSAERALLLCRLLGEAGIKADVTGVWPAFCSRTLCTSANVKSWLVRARVNEKTLFLDAETGTTVNPNLKADVERLLTIDGETVTTQGEPLRSGHTDTLRLQAGESRNGYLVCRLPKVSQGIDSWNAGTLPRLRESETELPYMPVEEDTFVLCPPTGFSLQGQPRDFSLTRPCGEMTQTHQKQPDGSWRIVRRITLHSLCYTTGEYTALRDLLTEWASASRQVFLFKKEP